MPPSQRYTKSNYIFYFNKVLKIVINLDRNFAHNFPFTNLIHFRK